METEGRFGLISPEGIALETSIAGLGSRFVASIIDTVLQGILTVAFIALTIAISGDHHSYFAAVGVVLTFIDLVGYHVAFEVLRHRRTPGKRRLGIRVTNPAGGPIRFRQSMVRNVLRIVDFLPSGYLVGAILILVSKKSQRLGDLVAHTLVVHDPLERRGRRRRRRGPAPVVERVGPMPLPYGHEQWDVSAVTAADLAVVRRFLERRTSFLEPARSSLATELARQLGPKVAGAPPLPPERFLEQLEVIKRSRL